VLASAETELRAGLAEAEAELEEVEVRRAELVALISQARAALGVDGEPLDKSGTAGARGLTLHEAMGLVLRERDNSWMTARQLADEINQRRLYTKRDGNHVEVNQIHARSKNYPGLFEKDGPKIRLLAT